MAVEKVSATPVSNADATPRVLNSPLVENGVLKESVGEVAVDSAASIGSIYRFARVRSNCRISQLLASCSAITSAAADIGVYETADNGGAAVDADFFASAQSLATALAGTDVTNESGTYTGAKQQQPLWQALGKTEDPMRLYDIAMTLTAAATAAGTASMKVRFADNG